MKLHKNAFSEGAIMKSLSFAIIQAAAIAATCSAETRTWITVGSDGSWSDVANWEGGAKPAPDGSSDVVISNNVSSASVSRKIIVNEDASVKSLCLMRGATATYTSASTARRGGGWCGCSTTRGSSSSWTSLSGWTSP